jgi:hypothetical protein
MNLTDPSPQRQPLLDPRVMQIRRTLRLIWAITLLSMGWVVFVFYKGVSGPISPSPALPILAGLVAALSFFVPDFISKHLTPKAAGNSLDTRLGMVMINYILRFALSEAGLVLLLISNAHPGPESSFTIYLLVVALMIFHFPKNRRFEALLSVGFPQD